MLVSFFLFICFFNHVSWQKLLLTIVFHTKVRVYHIVIVTETYNRPNCLLQNCSACIVCQKNKRGIKWRVWESISYILTRVSFFFFLSISSFSNPVPLYSPPLPCPFSTTGLFTKAIMESGVSLSWWVISLPNTEPEPRRQAMELASRLGCGVAESTHMLACLRTKDTKDIVETTADLEV